MNLLVQVLEAIDPVAPDILATLLTWLAHGTIVIALLLGITRLRIQARVEEALWKSALVLPFLTTAWTRLQPGSPWTFRLDAAAMPLETDTLGAAPTLLTTSVPSLAEFAAPPVASMRDFGPATWIVAAVACMTVLGVVWAGLQRMRLASWLAARIPIEDRDVTNRVVLLATRLGLDTSLRVSARHGLDTPIAFGVLRPEICLPPDALTRLSHDQGDAVLAHELAHITCRDPLWFGLSAFAVQCFPWQPLLRVVKKRLETLAEYRCDGIAAEVTSRESVASGLVEVASWLVRRPRFGLAGMAARRSALRTRVERVLDSDEPARFRRGARVLTVLLLASSQVAFAMPRFETVRAAVLPAIQLGSSARALFAALVTLDVECAQLASDFGTLQAELAGGAIDGTTLSALQLLGRQLNTLDARRIALRERILEALAIEATRLDPSVFEADLPKSSR
ncbi:MAG: M56 family metallopeptidase [Planctomycetes bacterium]|nr:M56 family metallopeptidase [Planctomycetota bacterium]MCB9891068.1 M56 family metallopeptidase [Planctomycetota bacterium]MCB9916971.1 M56 family metallopeptidase [Planctomycetota bacterium]